MNPRGRPPRESDASVREMEQMRELLGEAPRNPMALRITCVKCQFFRNVATYGRPCEQLGVVGSEDPCPRFVVNPRKLKMEEEATHELLDVVGKLDSRQLDVLAALLHTSRGTFRQGFVPGQVVYFRVIERDYLRNYAKGRILSASRHGIHIYGDERFTASILPSSVLTLEQWKEKRRELRDANRIEDPRFKMKRLDGRLIMTYDPPTITSRVQENFLDRNDDQEEPTTARKKRQGNESLSLRG